MENARDGEGITHLTHEASQVFLLLQGNSWESLELIGNYFWIHESLGLGPRVMVAACRCFNNKNNNNINHPTPPPLESLICHSGTARLATSHVVNQFFGLSQSISLQPSSKSSVRTWRPACWCKRAKLSFIHPSPSVFSLTVVPHYQSSHAFAHSCVQCPTPTTVHTCSHVHIHIHTSLRRHLCHITNHTRLCWHPLFCTIFLAVRVATLPIALICSHLFSMYHTCHVTDHICMFVHPQSFFQSLLTILYLHHRYTFVFDNIPSTTSSIAQPPPRSERTSICKFVAPQSRLQFSVEGWSSLLTDMAWAFFSFVDVDGDFRFLFTFISIYCFYTVIPLVVPF